MRKKQINLIVILGVLGMLLCFGGALAKLEHMANANYILSAGFLLQILAGGVAFIFFLNRKQAN